MAISETKTCQNCEAKFDIDASDFAFYEKMKVPAPTWCPDCRLQRRLVWVSPYTLYQRPVDGKSAISMYAPEKEYNIVDDGKWWAEEFDLTEHGRDYDFTTPFFQQFNELLRKVPLPHLQRNYGTFENSDFCNAASYLKNCYLTFGADNSENLAYCNGVIKDKDSIDLSFVDNSELCYECFKVYESYRCFFCQDVRNSSDLIFCRDMAGCQNCVGCTGLRNQSYHIFNQLYPKEEYEKKLKEFNVSSFVSLEKLRAESENFFLTQPHRFMHGRNNEDVAGDYIYQSKNVRNGVVVDNGENCKHVFILHYLNGGTVNAHDYSWFGNNAELVYDTAWCGLGINNIRFGVWNYGSIDLQYCFGCHSSQSLFGCVGLRKKKFCILNKQYSQEEYEKLVPKIIDHMNEMPYKDTKKRVYRYGEFYPPEISPFDYNETWAQEFVPRTRQEIKSAGYRWRDQEKRKAKPDVSWKDLPDDAKEAGDELVGKLILCQAFEKNRTKALEHNCTKVFKLIPQELMFYRKLGLPLPRLCPNSRRARRLKAIHLQTYPRPCQCAGKKSDNESYQNQIEHFHKDEHCPNEFETTYAPERKEIVYCEACYREEVA